jgi:hypothetical protein
MTRHHITLTVNGDSHELDIESLKGLLCLRVVFSGSLPRFFF